MQYLFQGDLTTLRPSNAQTIKVVLDVAKEVGYPVYEGTLNRPVRSDYPYLCSDTSSISQIGVERNPKSVNEWVTELYNYKKSKCGTPTI